MSLVGADLSISVDFEALSPLQVSPAVRGELLSGNNSPAETRVSQNSALPRVRSSKEGSRKKRQTVGLAEAIDDSRGGQGDERESSAPPHRLDSLA